MGLVRSGGPFANPWKRYLVAKSAAGETRCLLSDGPGSARQTVDDTGPIVACHEFGPYRTPLRHSQIRRPVEVMSRCRERHGRDSLPAERRSRLGAAGSPAGSTTAAGDTFAFSGVNLTAGLNTLALQSTDSLGNPANAGLQVTLDTTRPAGTVRVELSVFSPNGDGDRDDATFWLTGTSPMSVKLAAWELTVINNTTVITRVTGAGEPIPGMTWDGRQLSGGIAPDGDYEYTLTLTATNGLTSATPAQVVTIDTAPPAAPVITAPTGTQTDPTYTPEALLLVTRDG